MIVPKDPRIQDHPKIPLEVRQEGSNGDREMAVTGQMPRRRGGCILVKKERNK